MEVILSSSNFLWRDGAMDLSYDRIKYWIYAFIGLPVFIFLSFYLRLWIAGIVVAGVVITFLFLQRRKETGSALLSSNVIKISRRNLAVYAAVSLAWTFLGGQGGHFTQSYDWNIRNAVFRDLITRPWPVVYPERDSMLVYYTGHWMVPAFITKGLGKLGVSEDMLWFIGNQLLWIFTAAGVFIVMLLILCLVKTNDPKKQLIIPLILVGFSGLDIIGVIIDMLFFHEVSLGSFHIEWWSGFLQYSSMTTCLFWVFNQVVIPWIVILSFMQEKNASRFVYLGLCCTLAGPIPFLCVFFYMIVDAAVKITGSARRKELKAADALKEYFHPVNLISIIPLLIFVKFFSTNAALSITTNANSEITGSFLWFKFNDISDPVILRHYLLFLILEVMIYFVLLYRKHEKDYIYWTTVVLLMVAPFISLGNSSDFVMRFSVPALMVLLVFCARALLSDDIKENLTFKAKRILVTCLIIGSITPLTEFARGYYYMLMNGKFANTRDSIVTLANDEDDTTIFDNFMAFDYKEDWLLNKVSGG